MRVAVELEYLRSYQNGGLAEVWVDGKQVGSIDGLWQDPEAAANQVSVAETAAFVAEVRRTMTLQHRNSRTTTSEFTRKKSADVFEVVLKWAPATDRWVGVRQDQKVKLTGLVVCISGT